MHAAYSDVESSKAWQDLMSRLRKLRNDTQQEILNGTLDKFGNTHEDESRAVLFALNRILGFAPAVHEQYEFLRKKMDEMEKRADQAFGLHGNEPGRTYGRVNDRLQL